MDTDPIALPNIGSTEITHRRTADGTLTGTITFSPADRTEDAALARFHAFLSRGQRFTLQPYAMLFAGLPAVEPPPPARPEDGIDLDRVIVVRFDDTETSSSVAFGAMRPITYVWREARGAAERIHPANPGGF